MKRYLYIRNSLRSEIASYLEDNIPFHLTVPLHGNTENMHLQY